MAIITPIYGTFGRGNFDSSIDLRWTEPPAACPLLIQMIILVDFVDSTTIEVEGVTFHTVNWSAGEKQQFVSSVRYHGNRFWDDRFWLETPYPCRDLDGPPANPHVRRDVRCRFRLEIIHDGRFGRQANNERGPFHHRVRVVRLRDNAPFFRSHSHLWCHRDIYPRRGQVVVQHEIGHLLTLPHTGILIEYPPCLASRDGNDPACYAPVARPRASIDWGDQIMGRGMLFTTLYARPWQDAMRNHSGISRDLWLPQLTRSGQPFPARPAPRPPDILRVDQIRTW